MGERLRGAGTAATLQDGCAVFQALFQGIKESASFHKACPYRELSFVGRQVRSNSPRPLHAGMLPCSAVERGASACEPGRDVLLWRSRRGA